MGISDQEYLRQRTAPKYGDPDYIHLIDLLEALKPFATDEPVAVLDYGSGGSPYRSLFPNADYRRADFEGEVDYIINGGIDERDATFDIILSTQVAEHVEDPTVYFRECYRLLKPEGVFICTTHGTFPDHGCPYDFQRWTADGLKRDVNNAGFTIEHLEKITTNGRALMYLMQKFSGWFKFRPFASLMFRFTPQWQKLADRFAKDDGEFYLGLLVVGRK